MLWSKLSAVIAMQIVLSYALGRAAIPLLRKLKTGKYDPYIGDRFRTDGSEPSFGGAVMWAVFAFGAAVSAAVCGETARLSAAAIYLFCITLTGVFDDFMTDIKHKPYGVKTSAKLGWCYAASLVYVLILRKQFSISTAVLLPFRLGTIDFGIVFCPVAAAFMTAVIYAFRLLNRFGTDDSSTVGGLCESVSFFQMLGAAAIGTVTADNGLIAFGYTAAAAAVGGLIWGLSPSKLKAGSSGGFFCGGLAAAVICGESFLELAMLILSLAAIADAVCAAVQYLVYKKSRKFLLKGSSLHSHMTAKGLSDYTVIIIFSCITALSAIAAAVYAYYSTKILI
jgi:phospho-N-acetylmuramoyl-pentapeptide-transferase